MENGLLDKCSLHSNVALPYQAGSEIISLLFKEQSSIEIGDVFLWLS